MLINGLNINIRLTRAPEAFNLFGPTDDPKERIKILDATHFVTQIELKPLLLLAHANVLGMKRKAHSPVIHTQIKTFTASSGIEQVSNDKALLGPIPGRILLRFVRTLSSLVLLVQILSTFTIITTSLVLYVNGVQ